MGPLMRDAKPSLSSSSVVSISLLALLAGTALIHGRGLAGELYRWVDEHGRVHLSDTPPSATHELRELKVYEPREVPAEPQGAGSSGVDPGQALIHPMRRGDGIVVEAMLDRKLAVPLLLDTGADYTILTRQTAADLGITALDRLPKKQFRTLGGIANAPVMILKSLRVGSAEVRDVDVAIDVNGQLPIGLLGMTFLRHFKVTVDRQQGQVRFER
jgi:clan AA aspartic protease (TIGR02281 family)